MKVTNYIPTSSIDTSGTQANTNPSEEKSFEEVLVLNQTALKAMTIDALVKESSTGSVNPDSVDAAAIMKFRSTLGANVQAPIPEEDWDGGTPIKVHVPPAIPTISKPITKPNPLINKVPVVEQTPSTEQPPVTEQTTNTGQVPSTEQTPVTNTIPSVNTASVPNTGVLKCSDELNQYFLKASETHGVDVKLLKCIAYAESSFRPDATSRSGAMGIMQLMPKTAEGMGVEDGYDPEQNIMGGARYIAIQLKRFDGNIELALAAYNAGPTRVAEYGGIPPIEETQNYVKKIMNVYNS